MDFFLYLAFTLISIALAPKPPKPKPAALEDFDAPTVDENRPVPVVFGTVRMTGPTLEWYGDLAVKAIRKRTGFSKTTVGYKYYLGMHFVCCHGPIDELAAIEIGEKEAWSGSVITDGDIAINQPELFGGDKREGGVVGTVNVRFGTVTQAPNAYLQGVLGTPLSAYRDIFGLVFVRSAYTSGYVGTQPYLKPWAFWLRRNVKGWENDVVWYSAKAKIGANNDQNPAHIIYEAVTNRAWGMGYATSAIDEASFTAVADQLHAEGFGLSLIYVQQTSIEDFVQQVLDHIGGLFGWDPLTAKYRLKLIRGDYVAASLPLYDESNIQTVESFARAAWGDTTNEITVTWTDPETGKDTATPPVQDLANITAQGRVVSQTIAFPGIRSAAIAARAAQRELAMRATPLATTTFIVDRTKWAVARGDTFRFSWAKLGVEQLVMRVVNVKKGARGSSALTIEAAEDVFGLPGSSYVGQAPAGASPSNPSTPATTDAENAAVISASTTAPPATPADGDTYLVPTGATGAWSGHAGELAIWDADAAAWIFETPGDGTIVKVSDTGEFVETDGAGGVDRAPWELGLVRIRTHSSSDATTLGLADAGACVEMDRAGANTVTCPAHATVAIPVGSTGLIRQQGAGKTTLVAASGVTIRTPTTLGIRMQYGMVSWHKRADNEFTVEGNLDLA